jgi:hypothetical protein
LARTTFCYPDSVFEPAHFGVAVRLSTLVDMASADDKDLFDDYIEAHVHGVVDLGRDVEALVLDPCCRGTPVAAAVGALLPGRMARRLRADHDVATRAPGLPRPVPAPRP